MESVIEGLVRIKGTDDEHNNLYRTEQRSSLGGVTARLDELEKRVSAIAGPSSSSSETDLARKAEVMILRRCVEESPSKAEFEDEVETVEKLAEDIALLKKVVTATPTTSTYRPLNAEFKVPEPKSFGGTRSSKDLENYLWDIEQYFHTAKISVSQQVHFAAMYLTGDAKLWRRTRCTDENATKVESWEDLKRELKAQFLPTNTSWVARDSLRKLKQTGSMRDYVKEFTSLMLDVKDMSEQDKLFNFMSGLQNWAQAELNRQGVQTLPQAVAAAEKLVDF